MNKKIQDSLKKSIFPKWKPCTLALFIILSTASCQTNTAESTLSEFLDHTYLDNNGKKGYELISSDDKKYISKGEFIIETKRKNIFNKNFLKSYKGLYSYEILETKQCNSDTIKLKVVLRKPNTNLLLNEMVSYTMAVSSANISGKNKHKVTDQKFSKIIANNDFKIETESKEYILIKENRRYKIYLNLNPSNQPRIVHNSNSRRY